MDGQRVIIFGGYEFSTTTTSPVPEDLSLYELSLTNFEWTTPKTSGQSPKFYRYGHSADIIGNYMVISFGKYICLFSPVFNKSNNCRYLEIISLFI